jgi:hypothetical protein
MAEISVNRWTRVLKGIKSVGTYIYRIFSWNHVEDSRIIAISLGSSCDSAKQLKGCGFQAINYYFDFIWNEYDGLKNATNIIKSDFKNLDKLENYTKTDKEQPFLKIGRAHV